MKIPLSVAYFRKSDGDLGMGLMRFVTFCLFIHRWFCWGIGKNLRALLGTHWNPQGEIWSHSPESDWGDLRVSWGEWSWWWERRKKWESRGKGWRKCRRFLFSFPTFSFLPSLLLNKYKYPKAQKLREQRGDKVHHLGKNKLSQDWVKWMDYSPFFTHLFFHFSLYSPFKFSLMIQKKSQLSLLLSFPHDYRGQDPLLIQLPESIVNQFFWFCDFFFWY